MTRVEQNQNGLIWLAPCSRAGGYATQCPHRRQTLYCPGIVSSKASEAMNLIAKSETLVANDLHLQFFGLWKNDDRSGSAAAASSRLDVYRREAHLTCYHHQHLI